MNRRNFFRFGASHKKRIRAAFGKNFLGASKTRSRLRPPGAIDESSFLVACSQCGLCEEACPYGSVKTEPTGEESYAKAPPYLDPLHNPCRFCDDKPCIASCPSGALLPGDDYQKMGLARFHPEHCLVTQGQYCDYCFRKCPSGIQAISRSQQGTPKFDAESCVGCGKCAYICVSQSGKAITIEPLEPKV